jgi:hypothetical protein
LTLRYIFGDIAVTPVMSYATPINGETTSFSALTPMVYSKLRFNIPSTDIALQAEGNFISYNDNTFYDYELGIRYTFTFGLGIEGGYKVIHLDSSSLAVEDSLSMQLDENGFYGSLVWDF